MNPLSISLSRWLLLLPRRHALSYVPENCAVLYYDYFFLKEVMFIAAVLNCSALCEPSLNGFQGASLSVS